MRAHTVLVLAVGAGLAAGAVSCGGGSSKPAATASANGVEKLSPQEIIDKSTQALKDGKSAHLTGQINSGGQLTTIDLATDTSADCKGTIAQSGQGTFQIVKVGKDIWLKPDPAFWQTHGGPATAQLVGDKYLKTTSDNPDFSDASSICDLGSFADQIGKSGATLSAGSQTTLSGKPVVTVIGTKDGQPGTLYVATTGAPYPLRLQRSGTDTAQIDFKDFGVPVPTTTPSPDQSIDLDQLNKEIGSPSPSAGASL